MAFGDELNWFYINLKYLNYVGESQVDEVEGPGGVQEEEKE